MKNSIQKLKRDALEARKLILEMGKHGGCFVGSAFSCIDIVTYLYNEIIYDSNYETRERNYLLLSKGHAVPALYSTFINLGLLKKERLENYNTMRENLYLHPNSNVVGIEFHSGSLGHGIGIATGIALDIKKEGKENKVFVIVGDGELDEGSNWESILTASALKLDNLVIIVDRNNFQANFKTEQLLPLESLRDKFVSFGAEVHDVDGHDFNELEKCFGKLPFSKNKLNVVIANTIRGKGIKKIENDWEQWFMEYDEKKYIELIQELEKEV